MCWERRERSAVEGKAGADGDHGGPIAVDSCKHGGSVLHPKGSVARDPQVTSKKSFPTGAIVVARPDGGSVSFCSFPCGDAWWTSGDTVVHDGSDGINGAAGAAGRDGIHGYGRVPGRDGTDGRDGLGLGECFRAAKRARRLPQTPQVPGGDTSMAPRSPVDGISPPPDRLVPGFPIRRRVAAPLPRAPQVPGGDGPMAPRTPVVVHGTASSSRYAPRRNNNQ